MAGMTHPGVTFGGVAVTEEVGEPSRRVPDGRKVVLPASPLLRSVGSINDIARGRAMPFASNFPGGNPEPGR